jgi:hypothetical protein
MTCYSPLLGLSQGIVSSLTYSGHTLNQRKAGELRSQVHIVDLALYGIRGAGWTCLGRIPLPVAGI